MIHEAWLRQAESDLAAAAALCGSGCHPQAIWLAAQTVEKGLKAILAALGLQYKEKHYKSLGHRMGELLDLLPEELQEPRDPDIAKRTSSLESRAEQSRYPQGESAPVDRHLDSAADTEDARFLLLWCRERVTRAQAAVAAMKPTK